ncbi:MAG: hypothetical protein FJ090_19475 [Deltaproteobacteria bacterium]|nr:hypothetical protein [Deltaproteobacteria bacterium]
MIPALAFCLSVALAAPTFSLESAPADTRDELASIEPAAAASGFEARVVKRFQLGQGWTWVALVEGFASEAEATGAALTLATATQRAFTVVAGGGSRTPVGVPVATEPLAPTAASTIAATIAAHGGVGGGASELARAKAVHFAFTRALEADGRTIEASHDYWREGSSRRLSVDVKDGGEDSLLVVTASVGWLNAGGQLVSRDIGILVNQADAFAPEAVLGLALDVPSLLASPPEAPLLLLEGAERGLRVGRGEDPEGAGLAFADVEAGTGLLAGARYVTEAGPLLFSYASWTRVTPTLLVPSRVRLERPDGRVETVSISKVELVDAAPAGTFTVPGADAP